MLISGVQPFTLLDYPGRAAAIVFTPGCNMRCGFCHNPEFVLPEKIIQLKDSFIPEAAFFSFLAERRNLLDGVVVSGGEPTLAPDLPQFIQKIKSLGFKVKLDTNGNRPDVLAKLLTQHLVDYVAMDVKTSLADYRNLVGKLIDPQKIKESITMLCQNPVDSEFRSTLIAEVHSAEVLNAMNELLQDAKKWWLQKFRPGITLLPQFGSYHSFSNEQLLEVAARFATKTRTVAVRT